SKARTIWRRSKASAQPRLHTTATTSASRARRRHMPIRTRTDRHRGTCREWHEPCFMKTRVYRALHRCDNPPTKWESCVARTHRATPFQAMSDTFEIETPRLRLTGFTERHFDRYAAMLADPTCTRWIGDGHALDRMNAWRSMAMLLGHWQLRGFGMWALENLADDTFVGRVGLM